MGIFCQINLCKPSSGIFCSGDIVSGIIKYAIDEPTEFEKITTSLKGIGYLRIEERKSKDKKNVTYSEREVYIDTDEVVEGKSTVPVGAYELKFTFKIPESVPPTFEIVKNSLGYRINCKIKYYVRIKFDRCGWFSFAKHFRKEITVTSLIKPKLMMEPILYGERKNVMRLFSSKPSTVAIKANIMNSVIPTGGRIELQYEVTNDSNTVIKTVKTKLMEVLTFNAGSKEVKTYNNVTETGTKTGSVKAGSTLTMPIEINVATDKVSFENSRIISRDYIVRITAVLPIPHMDVLVDIPVQIGDTIQSEEVCDPPPSYWEAMGEENEMLDNEKGEKL